MPVDSLVSAELPRRIKRKLAREGIAAITFDDSIGRLCIVSGDDPKNLIVLDYAGCFPFDLCLKWQDYMHFHWQSRLRHLLAQRSSRITVSDDHMQL